MKADRGALQFADIVLRHFDYLVVDWGFACVEQGDTLVRFESPTTKINVYHGRQSGQVNVECGRVKDDKVFDMAQLLEYRGKLERADFDLWEQAFTPEAVRKNVSRLACLLSVYGKPLLEGDATFIDRIFEQLYWRQMQEFRDAGLRQAILYANSFWSSKNYPMVIYFLKPYVNQLSPDDRAKYEFAVTEGAEKTGKDDAT